MQPMMGGMFLRIIFIKNYRRKAVILSAILLFCVIAVAAASITIRSNLLYNVTINNYLSFSYPFSMDLDNIFVNEQIGDNPIQTSMAINKPALEKFTDFTSLEGKFSFSYPSMFVLSQQFFTGSEILYHIDFHDKNGSSYGFVQVWNMPYPLDDFLNKSISTSQQNYKFFNMKPVTINGLEGFIWDYAFAAPNGEYYKGNEAFFKKDEKMYRISYFMPEAKWNSKQEDIFWKMVNSFKAY